MPGSALAWAAPALGSAIASVITGILGCGPVPRRRIICRNLASTQSDFVAHGVEIGDLGAEAECPSGGAHIGGERCGECREVGDGRMG